jgi:hypothetical protein
VGVKPVVQTIVVATTTLQKTVEQVVQVERPKGKVLICRR